MYKVLTYGTLRKGHGNHRLLEDSKEVGPTTIKGTLYSLGPFPALSLKGDTNVECECYEVDDRTLERLDRLEGHPTFYLRELVKSEYGPAFVYTMDHSPESLKRVIPSGDWNRHESN
jgi:gamma-glutamylcyclotransferase (GGCT)/AIG2-like uncharacterized protein YtfP